MPLSVAVKLVPPVGFIKTWMADVRAQVRTIKADPDLPTKLQSEKRRKETIFQQILSADLPPAEVSESRLVDEGTLIATAGSETTSWALAVTTYHLTRNPACMARLREELTQAMPTAALTDIASWQALEKLPYLAAVVKEGLRMAGGMLSRFPRITDRPITYAGYTIPAGTPVAMTPHLVLRNPAIFPRPERFQPERWLDAPGLDRYMVAFGKGSRNCVGVHLAHAQLYVGIAVMSRRFELELFETGDGDVRPVRDLFTAGVRVDSLGIRVKVAARADGIA